MHTRVLRPSLAWLLLVFISFSGTLAFGQGAVTSTFSGTVTDTTGAVLPGADVTLKNDATGTVFTAVSGATGTFTIPAVPPGTYTATVSLQGFKTVILKDIVVNAGVASAVKAVLELGGVQETVIVGGATEVVQTQATSVATTLSAMQIANLPLAGRGAFDLVGYIPGVSGSTGSIRDSSVNGLPHAAVNITLDGMNIQDNYAKTWDGMFTRVSPRIDAVEEVTVSTAAQGADMGGQGAVQVKFVTRSGTNDFQGSAYFYFRRDWMNSNTWFNLHRNVDLTGKPTDKAKVTNWQPGVRVGGPIIRDKAFFFVNYEELRVPGTNGATRTIMSPLSEQGIFQYGSGRRVDLMALASANGQASTIDPIVGKLLGAIRASTSQGTVGETADGLTQTFYWQQPTTSRTRYPTVKLDYNITSNHRATFSMTHNKLLSNPDTTNSRQMVFPGFPVHGLQDSARYAGQGSVRSVLAANLVNEARFGATGGATKFSPDFSADMYSDMNGFAIGTSATANGWSTFKSISNPVSGSAFSAREGSTKVLEDTLSWMKGRHGVAMGASFTRADVWLQNKQIVPTVIFGMANGDPADAMFTTANFPGASGTDLTNAKNLYAVLTGRVTTIGREARIAGDGSTYNILGESMQKGRLWHVGFFLQDAWRWKPTFTVNAGLRYDVELPFKALNNSYSMATIDDVFGVTGPGAGFNPGSNVTGVGNLYKPGVFQGSPTTYHMLEKGSDAYKTDWNNLAPSIGAAWTVGANGGVLHKILGAPGNSVLRVGFNMAFQRGGMNDFTEVFGGNPGVQIDASRSQNNGNLGALPVLFRSGDLGSPSNIPLTREYPMSVPSPGSNVRVFDPNIKLPYAASYTFGWQRALAKTTSFEARFIHNDSYGRWTLGDISQRNYNELNIVENKFINEFRVAQANLAANIAAGLSNKGFAYTGAPGTSPLPIFFAHLVGAGNNGDPSKYTGSGWTNSTLTQSMYALNPNPFTAANQLRTTSSYRTNMAAGGLPSNFWVVNPEVTGAYVATNGPDTRYSGIQLVLNRRFASGLLLQANYAYGKGYQWDFYSLRKPYVERAQSYTNSSAASGNITHALAANWVYELPFGRGKRFGGAAGPVLHRIIGNWNFQGVGRFQSGRMVDFGNVRLVGFTTSELQKMMKLRMVTDPANQYRTLVYWLPQDIIENTIKAFSIGAAGYTAGAPSGRYFAPANGPDCLEIATTSYTSSTAGFGDCGAGSVVVTGPKVIRFDMNLVKQVPLASGMTFEFQVQVFNVFNRVNFNPTNYVGTVNDSYQLTTAVDQARTGQLAFRVSW